MENSDSHVTLLLRRAVEGDREARERLFRAVEQELRVLAAGYLARERAGHMLQTTMLMDDVFLRLTDGERGEVNWEDRAHFYRTAARAMRRMLIDHVRQRQAEKRGGGYERVELPSQLAGDSGRSVDLIALDDALGRLESMDPRQAQIVELHHFGGHTMKQTAELLGLSSTTVKREWAAAKAWLHMELSRELDDR